MNGNWIKTRSTASVRKPTILFLGPCWPHGPAFGGRIRALHIGRALKEIGEVSFCAVTSDYEDEQSRTKTSREFKVQEPFIPEVKLNKNLQSKLRWAFDRRFLNVHGCGITSKESHRLSLLIQDYDLIWLLNSRTPNILQRWQWPTSHLDIDDVPSTYFRTVAANGTTHFARWKARCHEMLFHRRERMFKQRFTTLSVCSENDKRYLGGGSELHVIPNGFEIPSSIPIPRPTSTQPRIGFIGLYSYAPNREGIQWFLRNCWPMIRNAVPNVKLRLIGRDTESALDPSTPAIEALGWISDPAPEISTWSAMIVPIQTGGGTRIKIAEAFSRKCPAVSTSIGAFGYEVESGNQILLANTPEDFAAACIRLIQNPSLGTSISERAWTDFISKWSWDAIAPKVWRAAEDCLRNAYSKGN